MIIIIDIDYNVLMDSQTSHLTSLRLIMNIIYYDYYYYYNDYYI
jgi:hypothetical protein